MTRRIDHLVVAVRDLDAAGRFYERLGFQVGARNRHPWGTENRLVQFDRSFVELITVGEGADIAPHAAGRFSFGAFVRDYLARREGLAMLVLDSADAATDARAFAAAGIGDFAPFFFERRGRRPDGSETQVAFTLAFARDETLPQAGFFVCQQHFPENFWNPAFQAHPNGASGIAAVTLATREPARRRAFLEAFAGAPARSDGEDLVLPLDRGAIVATTPARAVERFGSTDVASDEGFAAFTVGCRDVAAVAARLDREGIAARHIGPRLVVPAAAAMGVAIAFELA